MYCSATIFSLLFTFLVAMGETAAQQLNAARVLVYSATRGFRHDSIPTAVDALLQAGPSRRIAFDHTEDQTWFTDDRLAQYDAVLFLSNTGEGALGSHSVHECTKQTSTNLSAR